MIKIALLTLLLLHGCSLKSPQNDWQRKSSNAFSSYTNNFLNGDDALASNDLSRAMKHAKQSADLTQLAKIYLGECALNISAGIKDTCNKYENISDLVTDKELDAYYSLLTHSLQKEHIKLLPTHYQNFASAYTKQDFQALNKEILNMKKLSSSFLCASLSKEKLDAKTREHIIKSASFNGHKKIVLFWLKQVKKTTNNLKKQKDIDRKISILTSK